MSSPAASANSQIPVFTKEEIAKASEAVASTGGLYTMMPATIRGIDYPRIFAASAMSLRDVIATAMVGKEDNEFLVYQDFRLTTGEAWKQACRIAHALIDTYGVKPGDRVAIAMRNYPEWCIAYLGIIAAGCTVVPINAWWKGDEIKFALEDCGAQIVILDAKRFSYVEPLKQKLGLTMISAREEVAGVDAKLEDLIAGAASDTLPQTPIDPDSDFCILYTSGSTGNPKGAQLTHRGVVNSILSWSFMLETYKLMRPEVAFEPEGDATLLALPLFHVTASHSAFLLSFLRGRKIVFMYKWSAEEAIRLIKEERITSFPCVPTQANELVRTAQPGDLDTLVDLTCGGAARSPKHMREQAEKIPGVRSSVGYGLTETNALGAINALGDYYAKPGSAGRVVPPVTDIEIWDDAGKVLPVGEVGEVMIKSPANFRGYLNLPELTAKALTKDGWFHTGDMGKFDEDGFLFIVDRLKDLIIRGGENISCLEVENAIYTYENVQEVTVFSIPDDTMGEIVGAVIYPGEGNSIDLSELADYLKSQIAAFKVPERMWISPQPLPRGATDKIDKRFTKSIALQNKPHFGDV